MRSRSQHAVVQRTSGPALLAALIVGSLASSALAQPQPSPQAGGDPGRSGDQRAEAGGLPVRSVYALTGPEDRAIATSALVTDGPAGTERVMYGTADGRVPVRQVADGRPVGPPGGIKLSDEPRAFGETGGGFADTSTASALGQMFVAYNDGGGVSVAQVDEATGALVQRVPVAPGCLLAGSVLLSGPLNPEGDRALFFVAVPRKPQPGDDRESGLGSARLFKVTVTRPQQREAGIGPVTDTGGIHANLTSGPSLVYLASNNGVVEPYVALGTTTGHMLTFSMPLLVPGPQASAGGQYDRVMTPSVPVTPSGLPPGADGSGMKWADQVFVASTDGRNTVLHRITRPDTGLRLSTADSALLPGEAAMALATNELSVPNGSARGLVYVATTKNLYALDVGSLAVQAKLSPTDLPAGAGFTHTAPVVAGDVVVVARDNGQQLVLDARTLQPVPDALFHQDERNAGAGAALGRPALSNRYLQFASDQGFFTYLME